MTLPGDHDPLDIDPMGESAVPEGADDLLEWYSNPRKSHHAPNVGWMRPLMLSFSDVVYYHPDKEKAPWHIQAKVAGHLVNFWPCAGKAQIDGEQSVQGRDRVATLLNNCVAFPYEEFDPIDDGDEYE